MPSNYTGNPGATQSPGPAPALGVMPVGALPIDTDVPNASSVDQPFKESMDWIGFLSQGLLKYGVTPWSNTQTYTAGIIVQSPSTPFSTFRVKSGHTSTVGNDPAGDTTNWEAWGHTDAQITAMLPTVQTDTSATYIAVAISGTTGTITNVCWTAVGTGTIIKRCSFQLGTGGGGVTATITFSGTKAFSSGIKTVQVTATHVGSSVSHGDALIVSPNVITVTGDVGGDTYFVTVEGY